jgi:hypothetical protein
LGPQVPLQPSEPQVAPVAAQLGVHTHWPLVQVWPAVQVPQVPLQPSLPHLAPVEAQLGVQTH